MPDSKNLKYCKVAEHKIGNIEVELVLYQIVMVEWVEGADVRQTRWW